MLQPKETRLISETAGLYTADEVATKIVDDAWYITIKYFRYASNTTVMKSV